MQEGTKLAYEPIVLMKNDLWTTYIRTRCTSFRLKSNTQNPK